MPLTGHRPTFEAPRNARARDVRTEVLLVRAREAQDPAERREAAEQVASRNRGLALGVARRFHGRGLESDDVDQVALLGLWKAVLGYQPRPGSTFAAYAVPTVLGEVKRHFRDHGWLVRPTRRVQERCLAFTATRSDLREVMGREPTDREVGRVLSLTPGETTQVRLAQRGYHGESIDQPTGDGAMTVGDRLADPEDVMAPVETTLLLRHVVRALPERERRLLWLRYYEGLSQEEIGRRVGLSQMHISRLLRRTHDALRISLEACGDEHDSASP